jgi:23S rRNA pseudouridine1911/1915/1917 synthase
MEDKAYKILAIQLGISGKRAKELIDRGIVYVGDRKVKIARAVMPEDTKFRVEMPSKIKVIYEDDDILVVNKPAFLDSYDVEATFNNAKLIHRLDRETSGVLLLAKNDEFLKKAIETFRNRRVKKFYTAWVEGVVYEEMVIDLPIHTIKGPKSISKIDKRLGKEAITIVKPNEVQGKKSKVDIEIKTGRTHQIRLHLSHIGHPVVGDEQYGSPTKSKRILLHASKIEIFGKEFEAKEPKDIQSYK